MRSPDHTEGEGEEEENEEQEGDQSKLQKQMEENRQQGGGGWGGWGLSSFFVLSDLQKAAEEISRNAVEVAKNAAKSIADVPSEDVTASISDPAAAEAASVAAYTGKVGVEESSNDILRNSALDRLEQASEDTLLGQGLKVLDNSVDSLASGAWLALGSALKGGSNLVQKLEHSAANLADSIQHGALPMNASSLAPSIIETGKSFTSKGMQVLERVGKETMELLITETGLEVEKNHDEFDHRADQEPLEEITFGRCFYIYGGPEHLEELEALSNHYTLLFNRRKAKLISEQKTIYDGKLKEIQQVLNLGNEIDNQGVGPGKGKHIEMADDASSTEMKILLDSSANKVADIAAGFAAVLGGLSMNEIIQRTTDRLETVHAEGIHRLSEFCSYAVSHLLMLGKSVISNSNKLRIEERVVDAINIEWPEDPVFTAKIIRSKAQSMSRDVESVANCFVTGISEILDAYRVAIHSISSAVDDGPQRNYIQDKASMISNHLRAEQATAVGKIQEALQYLGYIVLSTSMPTI